MHSTAACCHTPNFPSGIIKVSSHLLLSLFLLCLSMIPPLIHLFFSQTDVTTVIFFIIFSSVIFFFRSFKPSINSTIYHLGSPETEYKPPSHRLQMNEKLLLFFPLLPQQFFFSFSTGVIKDRLRCLSTPNLKNGIKAGDVSASLCVCRWDVPPSGAAVITHYIRTKITFSTGQSTLHCAHTHSPTRMHVCVRVHTPAYSSTHTHALIKRRAEKTNS